MKMIKEGEKEMKLNALLDPRGFQEREVITLAKRVSLEELRSGKVLFYNNTKLGFCNYYTVLDVYKRQPQYLRADHNHDYRQKVRGKGE